MEHRGLAKKKQSTMGCNISVLLGMEGACSFVSEGPLLEPAVPKQNSRCSTFAYHAAKRCL